MLVHSAKSHLLSALLLALLPGTALCGGYLVVVAQPWQGVEQAKLLDYSSVKRYDAVWYVIDARGVERRIPKELILATIPTPAISQFDDILTSEDVEKVAKSIEQIESFLRAHPEASSKLGGELGPLKDLLSKAKTGVRFQGAWMTKEEHAALLASRAKDIELKAEEARQQQAKIRQQEAAEEAAQEKERLAQQEVANNARRVEDSLRAVLQKLLEFSRL